MENWSHGIANCSINQRWRKPSKMWRSTFGSGEFRCKYLHLLQRPLLLMRRHIFFYKCKIESFKMWFVSLFNFFLKKEENYNELLFFYWNQSGKLISHNLGNGNEIATFAPNSTGYELFYFFSFFVWLN